MADGGSTTSISYFSYFYFDSQVQGVLLFLQPLTSSRPAPAPPPPPVDVQVHAGLTKRQAIGTCNARPSVGGAAIEEIGDEAIP